jgi:hypothetical protein
VDGSRRRLRAGAGTRRVTGRERPFNGPGAPPGNGAANERAHVARARRPGELDLDRSALASHLEYEVDLPGHRSSESGTAREDIRETRGVGKRKHFFDRLDEYGFDALDAYRILDVGKMSRPRWDAPHENWTVRFTGKTLDGEEAAVVIAIQKDCNSIFFVTIEDLE